MQHEEFAERAAERFEVVADAYRPKTDGSGRRGPGVQSQPCPYMEGSNRTFAPLAAVPPRPLHAGLLESSRAACGGSRPILKTAVPPQQESGRSLLY